MTQEITVLRASWPDISLRPADAVRLRGAVAGAAPEADALHNHAGDGFLYRYPMVQYKVLSGHPAVLAAEEGIDPLLAAILPLRQMTLGQQTWDAAHLEIVRQRETIGDADRLLYYRFATPWLALNQENYRRWQEADEKSRLVLLQRVLAGNILSMAKAFAVTIEGFLSPELDLAPTEVFYKGEQMLAFSGRFAVAARLPEAFGLGKGAARGFGCAIPMADNE